MSTKVKLIVTVVLVGLVTFAAVYFGDNAITVTPKEGELPDIVLSDEATDLLISATIAPVVASLVELVKLLGWLPDGTAGKVQITGQAVAYLTVLFMRGFFGLDVFNPITQAGLHVALVVLQAVISIVGAWALFRMGRATKQWVLERVATG